MRGEFLEERLEVDCLSNQTNAKSDLIQLS